MVCRWICILAAAGASVAQTPYLDGSHDSRVFGEKRSYRVFLPAGYEQGSRRYPVIYYFHGHSDRYTLEKYDSGLDTVPKIARFVKRAEVIVVAADGYVARDYTGFYGGTPYDVRRDGGDYDYGEYFLELARHIDSTYRTLATRRYRATSGLSMGGFMSLYLSARYPDQIASASAFNPGPEFYVGEKGRRSLWRATDHVANHRQSSVRLVRASGDYISQYHEETREAYARDAAVEFEFRQDEYHRHWATSIEETFDFHLRAFANPALDTTPAEWSYSSAHRHFEVHGVSVQTDLRDAGFVSLDRVTQGGLRISTRRWAPDGPPAQCSAIRLTTAALYHPGAEYRLIDNGAASKVTAGADGRIAVAVDCSGHELSFLGPGTGAQQPVLLPTTTRDVLRVRPGLTAALPIRVYNPRGVPQSVRAEASSEYPTVEILQAKAEWRDIGPGAQVTPPAPIQARFTATAGDWAHARINLKLIYDGYLERNEVIDVLIAPDPLPAPTEVAVLDGRSRTFSVFRQKGNQGGGAAVTQTVKEGEGNGNGMLEPGEHATVWVRVPQGLDPFDKNNWRRAKVYADSPWLEEIADIQEEKQREWTGAQNRTSLIALSQKVPDSAEIPVVLDCESWSFHFTPDVRYGRESLYQAFQLHKHHLYAWTWKARHHSSSE